MINLVTQVCLNCTVENVLNYNIQASIFKELLKVAFKHFSQDFKNFFLLFRSFEPISTTYNTW